MRLTVAQNSNWSDRVDSEIKAQIHFATEWGSTLREKLPATVEEAIEAKEAELAEAKARSAAPTWETTTHGNVGRGENLDTFKLPNGKRKNKELMPSDRW